MSDIKKDEKAFAAADLKLTLNLLRSRFNRQDKPINEGINVRLIINESKP